VKFWSTKLMLQTAFFNQSTIWITCFVCFVQFSFRWGFFVRFSCCKKNALIPILAKHCVQVYMYNNICKDIVVMKAASIISSWKKISRVKAQKRKTWRFSHFFLEKKRIPVALYDTNNNRVHTESFSKLRIMEVLGT
jgi:hypothetical protein